MHSSRRPGPPSLGTHWLTTLTTLASLTACTSGDPPSMKNMQGSAKAEATAQVKAAPAGDKVFDPSNPPPGWLKCHRNHCHHQDGRVASYGQVMQEMGATRMVGGEAPKAAPPAPSDVSAAPPDAEKTKSGVASKVMKKGEGTKRPTSTSVVTVHYTGWTTDGKAFDSSIPRGKPAQFPLDKVIPGWTEGLQLMVEGEERRFWIPEALAYRGSPGKPAGTLVFDVELISLR